MGIKHTFVSGKSDSTDTSLVRPSNWNADHTIDGNVSPDSDNSYSLGISGTSWSDLWIGSGGKIDFATGDATLQHSTDTLTLTDSAFALSSVISPTALAADADDYAPTGHAAAFAIRQDASADVTITGLAGGAAGRIVALINISSANVISLTDEDTNSTAANRFAIGATITLDSDSALILYYDDTSSRWRTLGGAGGGKATLSDTAPAGASAGKIWIRTTDFAAFVYYTDSNSSQWVQFGGGSGHDYTWITDTDAAGYNLTDVGDLIAGTPTALTFVNGAGTTASPAIQAIGASFGPASIGAARFTATSSSGYLMFLKSRNATIGSHTVVQDGDDLGRIPFAGSDGTNFVPGAEIQVEVDGTPGTNDMPGRFKFMTTADGASTVTERMRIDSAGGVQIGSTADGQGSGTLNANNGVFDAGNRLSHQLLMSGSGTGAVSHDIDFSAYDADGFTGVQILLQVVNAADGIPTRLRLSDDGGTTFQTASASYRWCAYGTYDNATIGDNARNDVGSSATRIEITPEGWNAIGNATNESGSFIITMPHCFDPNGVTKDLQGWYHAVMEDDNATTRLVGWSGAFICENIQTCNAIRVYTSTGTDNLSVYYSVYGIL